MEIFIVASQFILSLSILIVLHEFGHFITARMFGMRVEKFYLFFNPWFHLFKVKKGETEYGIGWLPLGGYVKISGMIDESMDKEQMKQPPQPWEFRSKPAWQRLIVMLGGVIVNLILGVLIFIMVTYVYGEKYLPAENAKYGIVADSTAHELGLRDGDIITGVGGQKVENFNKILKTMLLEDGNTIQVIRDGEPTEIAMPDGFKDKLADTRNIIMPRIPFVVAGFARGSIAREAGIEKKDKVVGINDTIHTEFFDTFKAELQNHTGEKVTVNVIRDGEPVGIKLTVPEDGILGIRPNGEYDKLGFQMNTIKYTFAESVPRGMVRAREILTDYIKSIRLIFVLNKGYEKVGGFITMAKIFPTTWEWEAFWSITAFLSLVLAFMNVLPIPALDGGHVVFLLYEMISGKKPSDKFMEWSTYVGFAILLSLLLLANGNDVVRLVKDWFSN